MNGVVKALTCLCPTCGECIHFEPIRDSLGILHPPMPVPQEVLVKHNKCDLWNLIAVLSRTALNASKVTVFSIKEEG